MTAFQRARLFMRDATRFVPVRDTVRFVRCIHETPSQTVTPANQTHLSLPHQTGVVVELKLHRIGNDLETDVWLGQCSCGTVFYR